MNDARRHTVATLIGAALLRSRQLPIAARLATGAAYGVAAGLLLHEHAGVAGAVMVAIWIATVRSPSCMRAPRGARNGDNAPQ
jgi:hypothetical protein